MTFKKPMDLELKVGLFVSIGVILLMLSILVLGGAESLLRRKNHYTAHFPSVEGLISGAKVVVGGLQVGKVKSVDFDPEQKNIRVEFEVGEKYQEWIRHGSSVEILTQGVLGDKFISITAGNPDEPILPNHAELPHRPTKDLAQFLSKSDQLLVSLTNISKSLEAGNRSEIIFKSLATSAKNLSLISQKLQQEVDGAPIKKSIQNLNSILEKINNGTGSLGAMINDPTLYYDAKNLIGSANRSRIMRNLVRKTIKESEQKK